ncbi:InlB B-repeat-containing protein [Methanorbis furvi]|uniref:InlB B-repeat-containing protein n=1 Tax=Methanorbis furvi TaxID=3028299 RepID=UPI0030B8AACC
MLIRDSILLGSTLIYFDPVKTPLYKPTSFAAPNNFWGTAGGVAKNPTGDGIFGGNAASYPDRTSVLPYYTALNNDGTINKSSLSTTIPLTPGTTLPGVAWTDNGNGSWNLTLSDAASGTAGSPKNYQITTSFIFDRISIDAKYVRIDGANVPLTLKTTIADSYNVPFLVSKENVVLENLNITAVTPNGKLNTWGIVQFGANAKNGILKNSIIDASAVTETDGTAVVNLYAENTTVESCVLYAANSVNSSSQCIFVHKDECKVINNRLYPGKSLAEPKTKTVDGSIYYRTTSSSAGVRLIHGVTDTLITDNLIVSDHGASDATRNSGISFDGTSGSTITLTVTNNTFDLSTKVKTVNTNYKGLNGMTLVGGGYGTVFYLNPDTAPTIILKMDNNTVKGAAYLVDADNESSIQSITLKGTIYNNDFSGIGTGKDIIVNNSNKENFLVYTDLKFNITPTDGKNIKGGNYLSGNWWGTWSSVKKSTTGYLTYANAAEAKAAGLPVADLAPLVSVGTPTGTIKITGNLSVENKNSAPTLLTATFSDGTLATNAVWTVEPTGVITLSGTSGSSVSYTPLKVGNATVTATADVGGSQVTTSVIITVYEKAEPHIPIAEPTKKENGETVITSLAGGSPIEVPAGNPNIAVIEDTSSGTTMIVFFKEPQTTGTHASVEGNVTEVVVAYKESQAVPPASGDKMPTSVKYQLNLSLENVTTILPTINPAFNTTVAGKIPAGYAAAAMITAEGDLDQINYNLSKSGYTIEVTFIVPKSWIDQMGGSKSPKIKGYHIKGDLVEEVPLGDISPTDDGNYFRVTLKGKSFSNYVMAGSTASPGPNPGPQPVPSSSSSDGNMEDAFRVLFDTNGGSFVQPATGLSYGDRVPEPGTPTKDGYVFGGWYKDEAMNILWIFKEDALPGDMTLYAKWISGSTVTATSPKSDSATQPVAAAMQQQTTSSTQSTASSPTTPAGISPTMTQAPAPVLGMLVGLLAAGIFLRRRE